MQVFALVGSYSHIEHDVCIKALPNGGPFEKAGVVYIPRP
jgi:hypothetical protein